MKRQLKAEFKKRLEVWWEWMGIKKDESKENTIHSCKSKRLSSDPIHLSDPDEELTDMESEWIVLWKRQLPHGLKEYEKLRKCVCYCSNLFISVCRGNVSAVCQRVCVFVVINVSTGADKKVFIWESMQQLVGTPKSVSVFVSVDTRLRPAHTALRLYV